MDYREVQELMTDQVEQFKMKQLNDRYVALPAADPRKKAWFNTMKELGSFFRVSPTGDDQRNGLLNSEVQTMFALWLGLDIPVLRGCAGQKIGSQQLILDAAGLVDVGQSTGGSLAEKARRMQIIPVQIDATGRHGVRLRGIR